MLPVRCFTCNKVIGQFQDQFDNFKKQFPNQDNINYKPFFEEYNINRICCRKIFITHIDIFQYQPVFNYDNITCLDECKFKRILKAD